MNTTIALALLAWILIGCHVAAAAIVDFSPDEKGDRIAVVRDGKFAYLPATRSNIGSTAIGGGSCRYIRRASNGDLYVTGPAIGLFRSIDGGRTWTQSGLSIDNMAMASGFAILHDDTFLISYMPPPLHEHKRMFIARSTDLGKTWESQPLEPDISPCKYMFAWNGDMIQLSDGTLLQTIDTRVGNNEKTDDDGNELPLQLTRTFLYVIRSNDGGRTWGEKSLLPAVGGEAHLLELPSGKVMACVRRQRGVRMPGDPASVLEHKMRYGYDPAMGGGIVEDTGHVWVKNMFVSESYDRGYTWVNEQQVSSFLQCSGDMSYLADGTLVLQYLHRYRGDAVANIGIRARVSYDDGRTWEPEEYILSDGENYPGGIAMPGGGMISMAPHRGQIQALHWQPLPKDPSKRPALDFRRVPSRQEQAGPVPPSYRPEAHINVIEDGKSTKRPAARSDILKVPPGVKRSAVRYRRNSAILQRSDSGAIYCAGNVLGPYLMVSRDESVTWERLDLDIQGWGEMVGFKILDEGDFLIMYEPVGGGYRGLYTARSKDEGKTWSVTMADLKLAPFTRVGGKDNNVIELPDGTLVVVVQMWGGRDESGGAAPKVRESGLAYTLRSTDGGKTWSQRASICGLTGEARLVRLTTGKLLACVYRIRDKHLMLVESDDGGLSWRDPRPVAVEHNPGGETGSLTALPDGAVLLQFLYDPTPNKNPHLDWYETEGLRAIVSRDEGRTWGGTVYDLGRYAEGARASGQGAYLGDSVLFEDGRVLTACGHTVGPGMRFQAVMWRPVR